MAAKFGLSTVAQPVDQLGRQAAELALSLAGGAPGRRKSIMVPTRLVLRASTAPPADDPVDHEGRH
jgi:DNA-binding LacI/PurR family transcriptional regulator